MHPFRYALLRMRCLAPEDGAGGGSAGSDAGAAGAGQGSQPAAGQGDQGAAGGGGGGDGTSIFDVAGAGEPAKGADGKPARPDYVPEQYWDAEKGEIRSEQAFKSLADLRTKVARGEGKIPEKPDGYALPQIEGAPADLVKGDDPLWTEVRAAAHAANVTDAQLQAITKPYLAALAKQAGVQADPEAAKAAIVAERKQELAKLGPNGTQLVRDVGGWIAGMEARGQFTAEEATALKALGTAAGVRALAKLREAMGAPAIPTDAMSHDAMSEGDARKMLRDGHATRDPAKVEKATKALQELERQGRLQPSRAA